MTEENQHTMDDQQVDDVIEVDPKDHLMVMGQMFVNLLSNDKFAALVDVLFTIKCTTDAETKTVNYEVQENSDEEVAVKMAALAQQAISQQANSAEPLITVASEAYARDYASAVTRTTKAARRK